MGRFSSTLSLNPAGTIITVDPTSSNSGKSEAATDARVFLDVTSVPGGGAELDVDVQISEDGTNFADIGAFESITVAKLYVFEIAREKLGKFVRLVYRPASGSWTLGADLEKKQN